MYNIIDIHLQIVGNPIWETVSDIVSILGGLGILGGIRWFWNYYIRIRNEKFRELEETIRNKDLQIAELKDQIHLRNRTISEMTIGIDMTIEYLRGKGVSVQSLKKITEDARKLD